MNSTTVILILIVIAIVLVAAVLMLAIARAQKKSFCKTYILKLANAGNARSHYELWADDPAHVLAFDFSLNGILLGQMGGVAQTDRNAAPSAPSSAPQRDTSKAQQAYGAASGFADTIGGVLDTLGNLLPGGAGRSLLSLSMRLRQGENNVLRVERTKQRAVGLSQQAQNLTSKGTSAMGASRGAGETAPQQAGTGEEEAPANPQTPDVDPGKQLEVSLFVRPVTRLSVERVPFTVGSVCLEEENAQPVVQNGMAIFAGMTGFRYYLPYVLVGGVALLLIILLLASTNLFG